MAMRLRIVPYVTKEVWPARRGHPVIVAGTVVYTIELDGRVYAYSYLQKSDAETVVATMQKTGIDLEHYKWNFKEDPEKSLHVYKLPGKPVKRAVIKRDLPDAEECSKPESKETGSV